TTAIDMLMSYHWPGNVRELENCIERAVLVCDGGVIHGHHLPPTLQTAEVSGTMPRLGLAAAVAAYEKDMILDALKSARGNPAGAPPACSTRPNGSSATRSTSTASTRPASRPDRAAPGLHFDEIVVRCRCSAVPVRIWAAARTPALLEVAPLT